jgi:hypothetical protein
LKDSLPGKIAVALILGPLVIANIEPSDSRSASNRSAYATASIVESGNSVDDRISQLPQRKARIAAPATKLTTKYSPSVVPISLERSIEKQPLQLLQLSAFTLPSSDRVPAPTVEAENAPLQNDARTKFNAVVKDLVAKVNDIALSETIQNIFKWMALWVVRSCAFAIGGIRISKSAGKRKGLFRSIMLSAMCLVPLFVASASIGQLSFNPLYPVALLGGFLQTIGFFHWQTIANAWGEACFYCCWCHHWLDIITPVSTIARSQHPRTQP